MGKINLEQPASQLKIFKRFLPFMRPYRPQLALALMAMLTRPALNTAKLWLLKVVIDDIARAGQINLLGPVCLAYLLIAVLKAVVSYFDDYLASWVGAHISRDLRAMLYRHLQSLSLRFYTGRRTGDVLSRLGGDIGAIEDLLVSGVTDLVGHILTVIFYIGMLFFIDITLAFVALAALPFLALAVYAYSRRSRTAAVAIRKAASDMTVVAEETINNAALVKAFAREDYEQKRFETVINTGLKARLEAARLRALFQPLGDIAATVAAVAVLWVGVGELRAGTISLGNLIVFITYLGALYTPIMGLSRLSNTLQTARAGAERVVELLEVEPPLPNTPARPKKRPLPDQVKGLIEFEQVTFSYEPDQVPVLKDFSLTIRPGEAVAVVGPSGAGKTTLTNLLLRLYDPDKGCIKLDGCDLRDILPSSLREAIAIVMQEPAVSHASIAENIRYGRLTASDLEIKAAGAAAQIDSFVLASPKGYEGIIGQRGGRLSGGQKQRLAIARAFVRQSPILILDEATSALDSLTELHIRRELTRLMQGHTTLIIAHRLSTIRQVPRILVMDEGRLVEEGGHEELLAKGGLYARLYNTQLSEEAEAARQGTLAPTPINDSVEKVEAAG